MKENIFTQKKFVFLFALIAMFVWGCAYPFIKLGMKEFQIAGDDAGARMLFAGIRFTIAGLLTLLIAGIQKQSLAITKPSHLGLLLLFGLVNTALHYYCFYSGLAHCAGGKASIINSLSPFLLILMAVILFHEKMTFLKFIGCVLGFAGILVVNIGAEMGGFTFAGEGMILLNCLFSALGGLLTPVVTRKIPAIKATGYSLFFGGIMLILAGLIQHGHFTRITPMGILYLLGLITISMVGFILYNQLLSYNPVSEIAIFNALIPVFGTMMSCLMLGEAFHLKCLIGLICIGSGIYIVNQKKK